MSLVLEFIDQRWQLRDLEQPKILPVSVDFLARDFQRRLKEPKRSQLLFRALGSDVETVFDATAGLGADSCLMASWGFQVTACERNELIFKLLEDGLIRLKAASQDDESLRLAADRLKVIHADSREQLLKADVDVVYLDPMYPDLKNSALPKKEMQLLRKLFTNVDPEKETLEILEQALITAKKRVVLKRPPQAPQVKKPSHSLEGKAVRFDIFMMKN